MKLQTRTNGSHSGLTWDNCQGVLVQKAERMGWSLCIGAGSSRGKAAGVFPDWSALVNALMGADTEVKNPGTTYSRLSGFTPDALIEAGKDRLGLSDTEFAQRLQTLLYEELRAKAGNDWGVIAKCLTAASPAQRKLNDWKLFRDFFRRNYRDLTALQLARTIVASVDEEVEPSSVVSFNAEPLLYALVNAEAAIAENKEKPPKSLRLFNRVSRGISPQVAGRRPYIFCHGLLEVDAGFTIFDKVAASAEKLVFSESSYLRLANSSFSWQSAVFLGTAVLRSMVFVGVSFTDPNLRRWLASVHADRVAELKMKGNRNPTYEHYWLNRDPRNETLKRWTESLVHHLGVRLVWIPEYSQLEDYLRRMLSLSE
ncbi:MAG: SIR2 family protein [Verrucomicrobiales bacterium]|nr:SIR2 family protein [Verrucomicrobiales bacterium]